MGEYARQHILEEFGVDIGDSDDRPKKPKKPTPIKRFGCSCGRAFVNPQALSQHQEHTGHVASKRAAQKEGEKP